MYPVYIYPDLRISKLKSCGYWWCAFHHECYVILLSVITDLLPMVSTVVVEQNIS